MLDRPMEHICWCDWQNVVKRWGQVNTCVQTTSMDKVNEFVMIIVCSFLIGFILQYASKASTICKKIGKPSKVHAATMCHLFPSSSVPKRPWLSSVFYPTQPCVALQQQKKKKRQLDASLAKLLLYTYMWYTRALLKENKEKIFKVQAVSRSWSLHVLCQQCKWKMPWKEVFTGVIHIPDGWRQHFNSWSNTRQRWWYVDNFCSFKEGHFVYCRPFSCKLVNHLTCAKI